LALIVEGKTGGNDGSKTVRAAAEGERGWCTRDRRRRKILGEKEKGCGDDGVAPF
jgi:hypothetical protein